MMTRRSIITASVLVLGALVTFDAPGTVLAEEPAVRLAIVVAKDSKAGDLSIYDLRRAFKGEPITVGGKQLLPINYAPHSEDRVGFDRVVLDMSPEEAARYWIDRRIRGESGPPVAVESADIMLRVVARLDGAIGYVRTDAVSSEVRVIRIDGKLPSDKDYPIEVSVHHG